MKLSDNILFRRARKWLPFLVVLIALIILLPVMAESGTMYVDPIVYYSLEIPLIFLVFAILKWG